jgi:16S rRNA (guanine(527)-N(7))-methyltransferase RsmG
MAGDPNVTGWMRALWPAGLPSPEPRTLDRLTHYVALVMHWNARVRLVGPVTPLPFIEEHVADALWLGSALESWHRQGPQEEDRPREIPRSTLVDVGSGAGLPGIPLSIVLPWLDVTLVENNQKKMAFLRTVRRELSLSCDVVAADVYDWVNGSRVEPQHSVTRATFGPTAWGELGDRIVKPGGLVWWMLSMAQRSTLPFEPELAMEYSLNRDLRRVVVARRRPTVDPLRKAD